MRDRVALARWLAGARFLTCRSPALASAADICSRLRGQTTKNKFGHEHEEVGGASVAQRLAEQKSATRGTCANEADICSRLRDGRSGQCGVVSAPRLYKRKRRGRSVSTAEKKHARRDIAPNTLHGRVELQPNKIGFDNRQKKACKAGAHLLKRRPEGFGLIKVPQVQQAIETWQAERT